MRRFVQTLEDDYREQLASERSETERMLILAVLARRERQRAAAVQCENGLLLEPGRDDVVLQP
jgi:hypothetical protein